MPTVACESKSIVSVKTYKKVCIWNIWIFLYPSFFWIAVCFWISRIPQTRNHSINVPSAACRSLVSSQYFSSPLNKESLWAQSCLRLQFLVSQYIEIGIQFHSYKHRTRDRKVVRLNPGRGRGRIFFSRVNFVCWLLILFGVCSIHMLPQWHVKDPGHSAKSAGGRLHLNKHAPLTQESLSELTMLLSRHCVGTYLEMTLHATC